MAQSTNRATIVAKVAEITDRIGLPQGIETVEVEFLGAGAHRVLRIFIDKPGGITHADCEYISEKVGAVLDEEDVIPGAEYSLEVSSPGVERKLVRPSDFERFKGQKVKIALREPVENRRRWEGTLAGFQNGIITLEPAPGKSIQIALGQVQKANLKFEW